MISSAKPEDRLAEIAYEASLGQDISSLQKILGTSILDDRYCLFCKTLKRLLLRNRRGNCAQTAYKACLVQDLSNLWNILGTGIQDDSHDRL